MIRILVVDDEPLVVGALERMLRRLRPGSHVAAVTDGMTALNRLDAEAFDLVIADLDLPGLDGLAILEQVRDRHPQVVRFVLSGCEDPAVRLRTVPLAHRFLAKPCELRDLLEALEQVEHVNGAVEDAEVAAAVAATDALPSAPPLYLALTRALSKPDTSMNEVARIVASDDAMSSRVLQVVNSAFFGLPQEVTSITQALAFLGLQALKSLVLSVEAFRVFRQAEECRGFSLDAHKVHVLLTARIASRIVPPAERDEAFTAGLLHDVGKLVLSSRLPARYGPVLEAAQQGGEALHIVEQRMLGIDHAAAGAALLRLWGLPVQLLDAVTQHHDASSLPKVWSSATALHVADLLAHAAAAEVGLGDGMPHGEPDERLIRGTGVSGLLDHYRAIAAQEAGRVAAAGSAAPI